MLCSPLTAAETRLLTARAEQVAGCGYAFVTAALHDRRLTATPIPPSDDVMFQVAARFLSRMNHDRHRVARAAFTGLFSPRRVQQYRTRIETTAAQLIDALRGPVPWTSSPPSRDRFRSPSSVRCSVSLMTDSLGWPSTWSALLAEASPGNVNAPTSRQATQPRWRCSSFRRPPPPPPTSADERRTFPPRRQPGGERAPRRHTRELHLLFVLAGHDTTTTLITAGVHLLSDPS